MARMDGKIALIAGAGTGIGRSCMTLFAAEGATVVGVSRTQSNLDSVLAEVTGSGGQGSVIAADLSDPEACERVVAEARERYGRIDVLVHAAGVGYSWEEKSPGSMADVENTSPDKWTEVMAINLDAYSYLTRALIPVMRSQGGGAIVAVASISGLQGLPVAHAYTAAKGGMINLTRSIAVAYADDGIRANCLAPGFVATPMVASVLNLFDDPDMAERITPMKRAGTPEEMAHACLYLASDESSYCTGTVLVADGGTTARQ